MQLLPVLEENLVLYIQYLKDKLKSPASVRNYVAALKTLSSWVQVSLEAFHSIRVKHMFRGIDRKSKHIEKQAEPLTPQILTDIHSFLNMNDPEDATFWAALLISFMLMLRKSNLVPDTLKTFNADKQLSRKNLVLKTDVVWVDIFWSKTLQFRREGLKFPLLEITDSPLCPVMAVRNMFRLVPAGQCQPCFMHRNGSPWTYSQYQKRFRQVLGMAGYKPELFSSHSCRRGGANFCYKAGIPEFLIKAIGDWRSDCFHRYLDISLHTRAVACAMFRRALLKRI